MSELELKAVRNRTPLENDVLMHGINFFKILRTGQVMVATACYERPKLYKDYRVM